MLSGFPVEVEVEGDGLEGFAQNLVSQTWFSGLSFGESKRLLKLSVTDQTQFLEYLAAAACEAEVNLTAVRSPDGSLEGAFGLLLRAHRGEG